MAKSKKNKEPITLTQDQARVLYLVANSVDNDHLEFGLELTDEDLETLNEALQHLQS